jgi:hypothetical protein
MMSRPEQQLSFSVRQTAFYRKKQKAFENSKQTAPDENQSMPIALQCPQINISFYIQCAAIETKTNPACWRGLILGFSVSAFERARRLREIKRHRQLAGSGVQPPINRI